MDAGFNSFSSRMPCFSMNGVISLPVYSYGHQHRFTSGPVQSYSAFRSVIPGSSLGARSDTLKDSFDQQNYGRSDAVSSLLSAPLSPSEPMPPRPIARFPAHFYTNVHVPASSTSGSHLASFSNFQVDYLCYGGMSNQQQSAPMFRYDCSTPTERTNYLSMSNWSSPVDFSTPLMAPITPMLAATPNSWTQTSFEDPSHSNMDHFNTQSHSNATRSVFTQSDELLSPTFNNSWTQTGFFNSPYPQTATSSVSPQSTPTLSTSDELSLTLSLDLSNMSPVSSIERSNTLPGSDYDARFTDSNLATEFWSPDAIIDSSTSLVPEPERRVRKRGPKNPNRRPRVKFTSRQLEILESLFNVDQSPETKIRADLAKRMNLAEYQIKNWFKNQRSKVRNKAASLIVQSDRSLAASSSPPDSYNSHISNIYDPVTHSFVGSHSLVQF